MKLLKFLIALTAFAAVSCGPQVFLVSLEKRGAAPSGVKVLKKTISVAYVEGEDDTFSNAIATGFAHSLEKELFDGKENIGIYSVKGGGENYSSRDSLVKYLVETGDDILFLLDTPVIGHATIDSNKPVSAQTFSADSAYFAEGTVSFGLRMYVYDSLNKSEDVVRTFTGNNVIHPKFFNPGNLTEEALVKEMMKNADVTGFQVGTSAARPFIPEWNKVAYLIYYYETNKWDEISNKAWNMEWKEALEGWLEIAGSAKNAEKRAAAEFDIATACHILGDNALALEWLDRSNADVKLDGSDALRRKILAEM